MSTLNSFNIDSEFHLLQSYLSLGHKNHMAYREQLRNELKETIQELRNLGDLHHKESDNDIINFVRLHSDGIFLALEERLSDEYDKTSPLHYSSAIETIADELGYTDEYDNIFYATVVIMAYSYIERGLVGICDIKDTKNNQSVLSQARNHLDTKIDSTVWRELKFIRWLRNTIIHSGMSFDLDDTLGEVVYDSWGEDALVKAQPELINYLKSNNIYLKEYGKISLNLDYCNHVIEFAQKFFWQIDYAS